jgi:hypothetical protein
LRHKASKKKSDASDAGKGKERAVPPPASSSSKSAPDSTVFSARPLFLARAPTSAIARPPPSLSSVSGGARVLTTNYADRSFASVLPDRFDALKPRMKAARKQLDGFVATIWSTLQQSDFDFRRSCVHHSWTKVWRRQGFFY